MAHSIPLFVWIKLNDILEENASSVSHFWRDFAAHCPIQTSIDSLLATHPEHYIKFALGQKVLRACTLSTSMKPQQVIHQLPPEFKSSTKINSFSCNFRPKKINIKHFDNVIERPQKTVISPNCIYQYWIRHVLSSRCHSYLLALYDQWTNNKKKKKEFRKKAKKM